MVERLAGERLLVTELEPDAIYALHDRFSELPERVIVVEYGADGFDGLGRDLDQLL